MGLSQNKLSFGTLESDSAKRDTPNQLITIIGKHSTASI